MPGKLACVDASDSLARWKLDHVLFDNVPTDPWGNLLEDELELRIEEYRRQKEREK